MPGARSTSRSPPETPLRSPLDRCHDRPPPRAFAAKWVHKHADSGAHIRSIVIVGAARTPMGAFQGDFSSLSAHDLGGAAIKAAVERAGIAPELVNEC